MRNGSAAVIARAASRLPFQPITIRRGTLAGDQFIGSIRVGRPEANKMSSDKLSVVTAPSGRAGGPTSARLACRAWSIRASPGSFSENLHLQAKTPVGGGKGGKPHHFTGSVTDIPGTDILGGHSGICL